MFDVDEIVAFAPPECEANFRLAFERFSFVLGLIYEDESTDLQLGDYKY